MSRQFSIVIPCHNDSAWLPRSVGSAFAQTRPADEVIIIDDGSTDDTPEVCAQLAAIHGPALRTVRQDNGGVSRARNRGLEELSGTHVVFLDADDELDPQALEHYATALDAHDPAWCIGSSAWERDGKVRQRTLTLPADRDTRFRRFLDKSLHLGNISNMCFAVSCFDGLTFPEAHRFGEDLVVFAVLLATTDPLALPAVTAIQHRREDSLRSRASLKDRIRSTVPRTVFEHPLLPPAYAKYADAYWARHSRSIMKQAFKEGQHADAIHWYKEMVKASPWSAFNPKWTWRFLRAQSSNGQRSNT